MNPLKKTLKSIGFVLAPALVPFVIATALGELDFSKILERFDVFKFQIFGLFLIFVLGKLYFFLLTRHWKENFKDPTWLNNNKFKIAFSLSLPFFGLLAPALEELLCRAALVVAFSYSALGVWWAIVLSAVIFGFMHIKGNEIFVVPFEEVTERMKQNNEKDFSESSKQVMENSSESKETLARVNILRPIVTFILGIFLGRVAVFWGRVLFGGACCFT